MKNNSILCGYKNLRKICYHGHYLYGLWIIDIIPSSSKLDPDDGGVET